MKTLLSILVSFVFTLMSSFVVACETLPLLQISTPSETFEAEGALFDVIQGTVTFEVDGQMRTVAGKFKIATADGEIEIVHNHLVLHPSQVEESISVVLPEDQRYGLVNLGEELLDAVANTYGYGTTPWRNLQFYLRNHPEEVIPDL